MSVLMGSGAETARETAAALRERGETVGVLQVRLYRPFVSDAFVTALPDSCRAIAVLERRRVLLHMAQALVRTLERLLERERDAIQLTGCDPSRLYYGPAPTGSSAYAR